MSTDIGKLIAELSTAQRDEIPLDEWLRPSALCQRIVDKLRAAIDRVKRS
jgi:hypothetical protein